MRLFFLATFLSLRVGQMCCQDSTCHHSAAPSSFFSAQTQLTEFLDKFEALGELVTPNEFSDLFEATLNVLCNKEII